VTPQKLYGKTCELNVSMAVNFLRAMFTYYVQIMKLMNGVMRYSLENSYCGAGCMVVLGQDGFINISYDISLMERTHFLVK